MLKNADNILKKEKNKPQMVEKIRQILVEEVQRIDLLK